MRYLLLFLAVSCAALASHDSFAGDWPQILGPNRNGVASGEKLAESWPDGEPRTVWQRAVGRGYSGIAVSGGRAILFHRLEDREIIEALDAPTGKPLWKNSYKTYYRSGIAPDDGPRCVPTIAGDAVYTFGASGRLTCVALADGKERWSRDAQQDFGAAEGYFGAGSSPVVEGDKLLVNVGGRDGAGLVAFDTTTGKTVWKATNDAASYSSPVVATIDGARHAIFVTRLNIISVDPATGKERFREPFGMRGPTVNGANPLMLSDRLFLSASYGIGAKLFDVSGDGAKLQWESNDVMSSQYTTSVPAGEGLIGIDGRQDVGVARLRAFDPLTRKIHWTQEDFGMATLIAADNALVVMKTDGALVLIAPDLTKFRQLAAAQILPGTTRALPALADGRLYVRDERTLKCLDLGAN